MYYLGKRGYVVSSLRFKEADEAGITWHHSYGYGAVVGGNWLKEYMTESLGDSGAAISEVPWASEVPLVTFDELEYSGRDKAQLMDLSERLAKHKP